MFELKPLSRGAIPSALERAKHYRLLNEPGAAESICLDILAADPGNQEALVCLVLAMSDRFGKEYGIGEKRVEEYLAMIEDEYARAYYSGIVWERRAKAALSGEGLNAYEMFLKAMDCFEKAEGLRAPEHDDPILRWNGCARVIDRNKLGPREMADDFIE